MSVRMAVRGMDADLVAPAVTMPVDRGPRVVRPRVDDLGHVGRGRRGGDIADRGDVVPVEPMPESEEERGPQEGDPTGRGDIEHDVRWHETHNPRCCNDLQ